MKTNEAFSEQFKQFAEFQAKAMEPARAYQALAADTIEQVLRTNYAVVGDFVDFAIKQTQLPLENDNLNDVVSAQVAETKAFTEQMNARAAEYLELAGKLGNQAQKAADEAVAAVKAA